MNRSQYVLLLAGYFFFIPVMLDAQQGIRPAVILGRCQTCGNAPCYNCPKLGAVEKVKHDEIARCAGCNDAGAFCSARAVNTDNEDSCTIAGPVYSGFIPRSQGTNTARELVGWEEFIHQWCVGDYYLTTGHVFSYSRSFRPERIAAELFGDSTLFFSGSQVSDRGPCELIADNFGLSPFMRGSVAISPQIENLVFDNQFFLGLDPILCGLYVRVHMPIVHTRWNLRMCQTVTTSQAECSSFPACYMSENEVAASCDIICALTGQVPFGDMQEPWRFGKIFDGVQTKTGVADIDLIVGYDFLQTDTSHAGFYGQLAIPTGTRFTGKELFQPMIGNAKHVEFGIGFSAHTILFEHDAENNLAFYFEGNVVHMARNTQWRSFDFCQKGPLSRYMLLKEIELQNNSFVYTGRVSNGIDFATRPVSVSVAAKGDFSAKFAVRTPRIIADLGYNFFGQTAESIDFENCLDNRKFVIKGDEGVCGLEYQTDSSTVPATFGELVRTVPLNSSQSQGTIRRTATTDNGTPPVPVDPTDVIVTAFSRQTGPVEGSDVVRALESDPPVFITDRSLYTCTGQFPAQATHKVFGYLGYNCFDLDWCANPYFGIGGEVEFDARSKDEQTACNQWSIWIKGGFEF